MTSAHVHKLERPKQVGKTQHKIARPELAEGRATPTSRHLPALPIALDPAGVLVVPENGGGAGVRLRKVEP